MSELAQAKTSPCLDWTRPRPTQVWIELGQMASTPDPTMCGVCVILPELGPYALIMEGRFLYLPDGMWQRSGMETRPT